MATEILVNDGGAPARILPFIANHAVSGGHVVKVHTDGKIQKVADNGINGIGVAFIDAVADAPTSVITGHGVIVNAYVSGTAAAGAVVQPVEAGILGTGATTDAQVAVMMETSGLTTGDGNVALKKVMLRF